MKNCEQRSLHECLGVGGKIRAAAEDIPQASAGLFTDPFQHQRIREHRQAGHIGARDVDSGVERAMGAGGQLRNLGEDTLAD